MINIESIKGKIRNKAKQNDLRTQEVLQMYFFERFLVRLSQSRYKDNFVIKGGLLVASLIGIENRTTMDMDTTVKGLPLEEDAIKEVVNNIIEIDVNDGIKFEIIDIDYIRENNDYDNFRISLVAKIGKTNNPMKLDITTGDPITPSSIRYDYPCMFDNESIEVRAYTIETILAEKYESIIKRNITTTRMRDFYDLYALYTAKKNDIDFSTLRLAVINTARKRESLSLMEDSAEIISDIRNDHYLERLWDNYLIDNKYIGELSFNKTLDVLALISEKIDIK